MSESVIAIDPGERAGWASAVVSENRIEGIEHGVLPCKEMAVDLAGNQAVQAAPACPDDERAFDAIVYETWRPRPKNGSMNWIQGDQLLSAQLVGYGPDKKTVALASMPGTLRARMDDCHEQHDQDALMHLWLYYFDTWFTGEEDPDV